MSGGLIESCSKDKTVLGVKAHWKQTARCQDGEKLLLLLSSPTNKLLLCFSLRPKPTQPRDLEAQFLRSVVRIGNNCLSQEYLRLISCQNCQYTYYILKVLGKQLNGRPGISLIRNLSSKWNNSKIAQHPPTLEWGPIAWGRVWSYAFQEPYRVVDFVLKERFSLKFKVI